MTTGTNTAETRSASRCTGALPLCASLDEPGHLGERGVGADAGRAHDQPAAGIDGGADHRVAGLTSTGTDSPVSREASIADVPVTTVPSVATFSPGCTTNSSPTSNT